MECYCVARNKPIRREITKPQTATVISLWFWGLLAYPELYCDWPVHDQHSWSFSVVHGFLSWTVAVFCHLHLRVLKNVCWIIVIEMTIPHRDKCLFRVFVWNFEHGSWVRELTLPFFSIICKRECEIDVEWMWKPYQWVFGCSFRHILLQYFSAGHYSSFVVSCFGKALLKRKLIVQCICRREI